MPPENNRKPEQERLGNCFGKTLVVCDFDEKPTQSVAQITM